MRRIGLVLSNSHLLRDYLLQGVIDHRRAGADWQVHFLDWPLATGRDLADMAAWRPDGLLCLEQVGAGLVEELGVPVVRMESGPGAVVLDEERIGAAAADHLLELGLRRLAVIVWASGEEWATRRAAGFIATCARGGVIAERMIGSPRELGAATVAWARAGAGPSGLFTLHDWLGSVVADACVDAGIDVPGQLAMVGADDVGAWCELAPVPLSSVRVPHRAAARAAAAQLDRVLDGAPPARSQLRLPPLGVTVRRSTKLDVIDDPALRRALDCIAERAVRGAGVAQVVAASGIGRRAVEKRFRARLGRTILQTIHRTRIDLAVALLTDSKLSIPTIASRCGFANAARFIEACRRHAGTTPGALRRLNRR